MDNPKRSKECKAEAAKAKAGTAAMQAVLSVGTILSTEVELTQKELISACSKKRIAECAPEVGAWDRALGLLAKQ